MFIVMFVLVETLAFATCLYHGDVFGASFPLGYMKNPCFTAVGVKKMHVEHPQKTLRFWDGFNMHFLSPTAVNQ
jgi:hypothetical protein